MSEHICANVLCRAPFSKRRRGAHRKFCSDACRREETGRLGPDGRPRRLQRRPLPRLPAAPRVYQYHDLDRRGTCPVCQAEERWLYRAGVTLVVLCGRCAQKREMGIALEDPRLSAAPVLDDYQCVHGHRNGYFVDREKRKRCRTCHNERTKRWRQQQSAERVAEVVAQPTTRAA